MPSCSLTRRLALQASLGVLAGPCLAQTRLPQFRTARYQFVELDPVEPMAPLSLQRHLDRLEEVYAAVRSEKPVPAAA